MLAFAGDRPVPSKSNLCSRTPTLNSLFWSGKVFKASLDFAMASSPASALDQLQLARRSTNSPQRWLLAIAGSLAVHTGLLLWLIVSTQLTASTQTDANYVPISLVELETADPISPEPVESASPEPEPEPVAPEPITPDPPANPEAIAALPEQPQPVAPTAPTPDEATPDEVTPEPDRPIEPTLPEVEASQPDPNDFEPEPERDVIDPNPAVETPELPALPNVPTGVPDPPTPDLTPDSIPSTVDESEDIGSVTVDQTVIPAQFEVRLDANLVPLPIDEVNGNIPDQMAQPNQEQMVFTPDPFSSPCQLEPEVPRFLGTAVNLRVTISEVGEVLQVQLQDLEMMNAYTQLAECLVSEAEFDPALKDGEAIWSNHTLVTVTLTDGATGGAIPDDPISEGSDE